MNAVTQSNIDMLLTMLTSNRRWVRAKAIYFVERQLSSAVDMAIIEEILNGLRKPDNHLTEDAKGLSAVLEQCLSGTEPRVRAP